MESIASVRDAPFEPIVIEVNSAGGVDMKDGEWKPRF